MTAALQHNDNGGVINYDQNRYDHDFRFSGTRTDSRITCPTHLTDRADLIFCVPSQYVLFRDPSANFQLRKCLPPLRSNVKADFTADSFSGNSCAIQSGGSACGWQKSDVDQGYEGLRESRFLRLISDDQNHMYRWCRSTHRLFLRLIVARLPDTTTREQLAK
jgi:hypothetical protein